MIHPHSPCPQPHALDTVSWALSPIPCFVQPCSLWSASFPPSRSADRVSSIFVRELRRYYKAVRTPQAVHQRLMPFGFTLRTLTALTALASLRTSRFSRRLSFVRSREVSDPARPPTLSPSSESTCCPSHSPKAWTSGDMISGLHTRPSHNPANASSVTLPSRPHDSGTLSLAKCLKVNLSLTPICRFIPAHRRIT